jgi:hypothetical protein
MYIHEYVGHTIYVACKNDGNGEAPVIQISWSKLDVKRRNIYMSDEKEDARVYIYKGDADRPADD